MLDNSTKLNKDVNLIHCTKPGQVVEIEEDCEDLFLRCDELEEDDTVIDDD